MTRFFDVTLVLLIAFLRLWMIVTSIVPQFELFRILPQLRPGIVSTVLFRFIRSWNEYHCALVLVNSDAITPATTGVMSMLISAFNIECSLLMAA